MVTVSIPQGQKGNHIGIVTELRIAIANCNFHLCCVFSVFCITAKTEILYNIKYLQIRTFNTKKKRHHPHMEYLKEPGQRVLDSNTSTGNSAAF